MVDKAMATFFVPADRRGGCRKLMSEYHEYVEFSKFQVIMNFNIFMETLTLDQERKGGPTFDPCGHNMVYTPLHRSLGFFFSMYQTIRQAGSGESEVMETTACVALRPG